MKKKRKKAFSLVELLVTITILAILWTMWVSINSWYREKSANTKVSTDLSTIENTFRTYKNEIGNYPTPNWNLKYFTSDWNYAHDETEAFWMHWFLTEWTIAKRFISVAPIDLKTWNYYAYWKTIRWWFFEVAWVITNDSNHEAIVKWNYSVDTWLYNLIREYNWPWFVYDKSNSRFPYNPDEIKLVAKISAFTWTVIINDTITSAEEIKNRTLITWDNIKLNAWSEATVYFSDWSITILWDSSSPTELTLANLSYKKNNNLFSKVQLALNFWTVWVKASKLSSESSFDVYTSDTEASVRWTIYKVSKIQWDAKTNIYVEKWIVAVNKVINNDYNLIVNKLEKSEFIDVSPILDQTSDIVEIKVEGWKQESILKEWKSIDITKDIVLWSNLFNTPDPQTIVCEDTQHIENWDCIENIQICEITNWTWEKVWDLNAGKWWDCNVKTCNPWFLNVEWTCIENYCDWTIPLNWVSTATSKDITKSWTYSSTKWVCTFKCDTNYTWDSIQKKCNPVKKDVNCTPIDTISSTYNTVNKIIQTWNWLTWIPTNTTTYNVSSSNSECRFKCKSWYTWNNVTCISNVVADSGDTDHVTWQDAPIQAQSITISWKWCSKCPEWVSNRSFNYQNVWCYNKNDADSKYCINVIAKNWHEVECEIEKPKTWLSWLLGWCDWWKSYEWSWTYTPIK